jgi:hypothetical protein
MANERLLPARNLRHNVPAPQEPDETTSLMALAERYFCTQMAGQAEGTIDGKQHDLAGFLQFYVQLYGHRSDRYIQRYVKPDEQSLADAIDELD